VRLEFRLAGLAKQAKRSSSAPAKLEKEKEKEKEKKKSDHKKVDRWLYGVV